MEKAQPNKVLGEKWDLLKAVNLEPRCYFEDLCAVVKGKG